MADKIIWNSIKVEVKHIAPTEKNYKIRNALGRERLQQSLAQFGLAGNVVCNWSGAYNDKRKLMLIDGNSRLEQEIEAGTKQIWVSVPSRKLSAKEFSEMSAMFDLAKAGDVDMERIQGDLGKTKDFYDKWNLAVPTHLLDKLGAKQKHDYKTEKADKKKLAATKITPDHNLNEMVMIQLVYNPKQAEEFRRLEAKLSARLKTSTTAETILKLMLKHA